MAYQRVSGADEMARAAQVAVDGEHTWVLDQVVPDDDAWAALGGNSMAARVTHPGLHGRYPDTSAMDLLQAWSQRTSYNVNVWASHLAVAASPPQIGYSAHQGNASFAADLAIHTVLVAESLREWKSDTWITLAAEIKRHEHELMHDVLGPAIVRTLSTQFRLLPFKFIGFHTLPDGSHRHTRQTRLHEDAFAILALTGIHLAFTGEVPETLLDWDDTQGEALRTHLAELVDPDTGHIRCATVPEGPPTNDMEACTRQTFIRLLTLIFGSILGPQTYVTPAESDLAEGWPETDITILTSDQDPCGTSLSHSDETRQEKVFQVATKMFLALRQDRWRLLNYWPTDNDRASVTSWPYSSTAPGNFGQMSTRSVARPPSSHGSGHQSNTGFTPLLRHPEPRQRHDAVGTTPDLPPMTGSLPASPHGTSAPSAEGADDFQEPVGFPSSQALDPNDQTPASGGPSPSLSFDPRGFAATEPPHPLLPRGMHPAGNRILRHHGPASIPAGIGRII
jgi:hypothetical protein